MHGGEERATWLSTDFGAGLPTPVLRLPAKSGEGAALWCKDDGRCGLTYGGNKVRKLRPIFERDLARATERVLTFGSAGSHHVLATALYARRAGIRAEAVLFPQLETPYTVGVLSAIAASGCTLHVARSTQAALATLRALTTPRSAWITPGPIGPLACLGYADAISELIAQISLGALPTPQVIVVPAGSGATAAGLLLGVVENALPCTIVAVAITNNPAIRPLILEQAFLAAKVRGSNAPRRVLAAHLTVRRDYLGAGYGSPTPLGEQAVKRAAEVGLSLEHTYTGKALAAAADLSKDPALKGQHVLYWQTVSQHPMQALTHQESLSASFAALRSQLLRPLPAGLSSLLHD